MAEPRRDRFPRSPIQRTLFFEERGGICECGQEHCAGRIRGPWEIDHIVARSFGGSDDWSNLRLLADECHKPKTAKDVADLAKSNRVKAKSVGAWKPERPAPCGRKSKWKRKVGGKVVRRDEDGPARMK